MKKKKKNGREPLTPIRKFGGYGKHLLDWCKEFD